MYFKMKPFWLSKFSSRYIFIALILVAVMLIIYGVSDGNERPKLESLKTKPSKMIKSHPSSDENEYMTQSQSHLLMQRQKEQLLLAGINMKKEPSLTHVSRDTEHTLEYRVVHLDLKGAPPKVSYFEELFPFLKAHGANGILMEYEDMFPYSGPYFENVPAYNAYSASDIKEILRLAEVNKIEVIPLIQTFGHLEFFLKLKQNMDMREVFSNAGSLCPTHNKTMKVLHAMIDQVVHMHPNLKYLHIGSDEVYEVGRCGRCIEKLKQENWKKGQLFLHHVKSVARYVRTTYPHVMPLVWEDMFRTLTFAELFESGISQWVEPVVWNYHPNILMHITSDVWSMYSHNFKNIWIASAFKGATGPDELLTNFTYHLENHMSWMAIVEQFKHQVNFRGIMMTGWQRYDHFSVLCELLPIGIPSLILNLYYIQNYKHTYFMDTPSKLLDLLQCDITFPPHGGGSQCAFPGARILNIAQRFYLLKNELDNPLTGINNPVARGWLSDENIKWNFSNPHQVEAATGDIDRFKMELTNLKTEFRHASADIYDKYTIEEWIETNMQPYEKRLDNLWVAREKLLMRADWPRRPLNMHPDL
ncbi:Hexosaminidase D [Frankliniella fusca]|uniref:beta-N-acetylhexosaminidase n=1 Tax=Frankliniella fusca TaxID=407009 RepID=A0AAE1H1J0_9NEOP|nr:Hexosaminidase D [Frankliniella fusca]